MIMTTLRSFFHRSNIHPRPIGLALVASLLVATGLTLAEDASEVPFPKLPEGAGQIDKNAAKTFTTTPSDLKYRILRKGTGAKPTAAQQVEVCYHGWLNGGRVFDSSYSRGQSISFGLNQVIKGWTEGMQKVGVGGMIELEIPFYLGYGLQGQPPTIPPNATLHFLIELIDIKG